MQCQGGRSMFNLISLQSIGLPWNTEWKISKPEKGKCKRLFHKQTVKSWIPIFVIIKDIKNYLHF